MPTRYRADASGELRCRPSLRRVADGLVSAVGVVVDELSCLSVWRGDRQEEGEYEGGGAGWPAQARHGGVAEAATALMGPDVQGGSDVFTLVIEVHQPCWPGACLGLNQLERLA